MTTPKPQTLPNRLSKLPANFLPELVIHGSVAGELWGWGIVNMMPIALQGIRKTSDEDYESVYVWSALFSIPPKLANYLEIFMAQHYHLLNNRAGIPTESAIHARLKSQVPTSEATTQSDVAEKPESLVETETWPEKVEITAP